MTQEVTGSDNILCLKPEASKSLHLLNQNFVRENYCNVKLNLGKQK